MNLPQLKLSFCGAMFFGALYPGAQASACSLNITAPANGSTVSSSSVVVSGNASASAEEGDQGSVSASVNGTTIFSYSGSFTAATTFFRTQGVSATLQPGVNIISASGSVGGCSASDSISVIYDTGESPSNNGNSANNTCNPINIASGNKFFSESFFSGKGVSPLSFGIYYNSNNVDQSWSRMYQQNLLVSVGLVRAFRNDGQIIDFVIEEDELMPSLGHTARLVAVGEGYELRLADNTVETYDASGQLLSIQYPSNIRHQLDYSDDGNTIIITRLNESLELHLTDGHVTRAVLPDNSEVTFLWDTSGSIGNLTQVTYVDNTSKTYLYENAAFAHYVTGILDENNNRISSVQYDAQGRAISSETGVLNEGINRTEIQYHSDGRRTLTNSLGKQNIYHFTQFNGEYKMTQVEGQASANCAAANQAYTYDANGFMASKTDWQGNTTTYIHNDRGLETSRTEASGTSQARTITTEWHSTLNLRIKITEPERETLLSYDNNERLISEEVTPR